MPIYRGPDGKIIEERTHKVSSKDLYAGKTEEPTHTASSPSSDDEATQLVNQQVSPAEQPAPVPFSDSDERTRLIGASLKGSASEQQNQASATNDIEDPVVGWLTVISGPGRGTALQLGYGANSIGRDDSERISLNFGDESISGTGHAVVTYEPRGRKFYLQNGTGRNLTYLNDEPILVPCEMSDKSLIHLGDTILHFSQLCGQDFDWQDDDTQ